jgi:hypothetical protein
MRESTNVSVADADFRSGKERELFVELDQPLSFSFSGEELIYKSIR